ncbi:short-chain dehydrogenase [Vararia minispora EC-137]|uniref:Short-chain dehydrogenase n=1 Tax=Vararia minispora EC-137 TaxID=1314806 RepID=A0ACB8R127_9AGAM|nr:short-chain dehydrogenase [Vararia minispora EC-137]
MGKRHQLQFYSNQWYPLPEVEPHDLSGRTVVVIGANVGLGLEAAKHFARMQPDRLIVACRSVKKCDDTAEEIRVATGFGRTAGYTVDLSVFSSVLDFAEKLEREQERLDIVVYNAAVATQEYVRTGDGYEQSMQVNDLSCMLLSVLLLPRMLETAKASGSTAPRPRLVVVSSETHHWVTPIQDALSSENLVEKYSDPGHCSQPGAMTLRYPLTKLLNVFFVRELAERLASAPIITCSVNPGFCKTLLARNLRLSVFAALRWWTYSSLVARTAEMGSRPIVWAAVSQSHREKALHGHFLSDMEVREESDFAVSKEGFMMQKKLWDEMVQALSQVSPRFKEIVDRYLPPPL